MSEDFFEIKVKRRAVRALERLPRYYKLRVLEVLDELRVNPISIQRVRCEEAQRF